MEKNFPLVNGTTFCTFYSYSRKSYVKTIEFYNKFLKLKISSDSIYYCTLSNPDVTLKVILEENGQKQQQIDKQIEKLESNVSGQDWRTMVARSLVFSTDDIHENEKALVSLKAKYRHYPTELVPLIIYTIDPLGNLVAVTSTKNSVSAIRILPPDSIHIVKQAKITSINNLSSRMITSDTYPSLPKYVFNHKKSIAVMTSGGDAPGMNANVRSIVRSAIFKHCRAFVIMEGFAGLVKGGPDYIKEFFWEDVRGWLAEGGTNIGTARCKEFQERAGRLLGALHLIEFGIDALIVCGGDGSLTGADIFRSEWPSLVQELYQNEKITKAQLDKYQYLNVCGTVGSIDNDMSSTDATIGAYSSLDRICTAVDYVEATALSHSRAFVIEVMGRNCGWLALLAGICTTADYIFIPENPEPHKEWKDKMCDIIKKHRSKGKRTTIIIVAEGAIDTELNSIKASEIHRALCDKLDLDTRITTLGHLQRGGKAVAYDRILATLQGVEAVNAVLESTPDTPSPLIAISENKIIRRSLVDSVVLTKSVAEAIKNKDFKKAMSLRDCEFIEHFNNFMAINRADHHEPRLPPSKRLKIAIVNIGAPAGGMNAAVFSMATFCMSQGHKPYGIYNGFTGLARHESVRALKWLDILGWESRGGSEMGTNRATPIDADIGMVAYYFQKYSFDGLILIGGFEAFTSLHQLERARDSYPAFRIPMVLVPATLSNNVPGTEYSLGADTSLNSLVQYCDVIKQSASSTRDRVFVVDVQGGNSGYLATSAALSTGAQASYVPEEGMSLAQISSDINTLKQSFQKAQGTSRSGKLILKTTNASEALNAKKLADILTVEAEGKFDAKSALPGHVQQGGNSSPIDRTRATRLAIKATVFIENNQQKIKSGRDSNEEFELDNEDYMETACVLGIMGSQVVFTPIHQAFEYETEVERRMPKRIHWSEIRAIADHLVGRKRVDDL
ncbi:hypothetical protein Kpol_1060p13 [Vanderwaltozyma polyspora DSM 70294]|uniref:ATP-dependent 6-phosphofructokinase n=1 Tax=Vanderwaltozyma polyspora (strain ATCC 22028 / DSM 70294 / BCRC 21397 / CBS 2163 / NBRC 10782 / NRRL Y-8283 / UCD 57-17) TaxID=436907 RepID=A7TK13_VANPO|nr:uncharacterized protein Kpol_1060p13 [Vanderwaltozyma polyspora DSM 70294]EDO17359.1 hypothetical protein Kpol_1060p13 [Vanderwaltozyma polyspora DSM 70294]